jgi:hypothetical protein
VDLREKAVQIMDAGNKAVHPGESSSGRYTFDEQLLIDCLNNLKEILEYLY